MTDPKKTHSSMKSFLSLRQAGGGNVHRRGQQLTPHISRLLLVLVNKVLLEYSPVCSFTYCQWLLMHYSGRTEELAQRPYENIVLSGPLQSAGQSLLYTVLGVRMNKKV